MFAGVTAAVVAGELLQWSPVGLKQVVGNRGKEEREASCLYSRGLFWLNLFAESSSCRAHEDKDPTRTEEEGPKDLMENSNVANKDKLYNMRYFIIKSLNHENIQLSVEKGIWATQVMNEPILEEAFYNSGKVILIFSVNSSGFFQGYAQMMSSVGRRRDNVWTQGAGPNNPWGRSFTVKWLRLSNLSFHKTLHLKNPLNEYKPVKISRDCQELSPEIGEELCQLIDRESEEDPSLNRDTYVVGRPDVESGYCFPDEGYIAPSVDMTWATKNMFYPAYLYQYHTEASGSLVARHGPVGVFPGESLPIMASKGSLTRHSHCKGSTLDSPPDHKMSSQVDGQKTSSEMNPFCSTLSEDDFLKMVWVHFLAYLVLWKLAYNILFR
ncbi:30-kDa cleavage and polyadenylation specificity factor 30 [Bienertia sinuspersici]